MVMLEMNKTVMLWLFNQLITLPEGFGRITSEITFVSTRIPIRIAMARVVNAWVNIALFRQKLQTI
jgi:hypothetical protein